MTDSEMARTELYVKGLSDGEIARKLLGDRKKNKVIQKWRIRRGYERNLEPNKKTQNTADGERVETPAKKFDRPWCVVLTEKGSNGFWRDLTLARAAYKTRKKLPSKKGGVFWPM